MQQLATLAPNESISNIRAPWIVCNIHVGNCIDIVTGGL